MEAPVWVNSVDYNNSLSFMNISSFPKHIFWQYKPDADLPRMVVLENVLLYGDLDDMLKVPQQFDVKEIAVIYKRIENNKRWLKRAFFIKNILM